MKTVSKTYFGCTVTAMNKGWPSFPWMFKVERDGHVWEFSGVPNYCASIRSALRRGWWRAKWIAEGTYDQHYRYRSSTTSINRCPHSGDGIARTQQIWSGWRSRTLELSDTSNRVDYCFDVSTTQSVKHTADIASVTGDHIHRKGAKVPKSTVTNYECDLCEKTQSAAKLPPGWVELRIEDQHLDRSWHDKIICGGCAEDITRAYQRTLKPAKQP